MPFFLFALVQFVWCVLKDNFVLNQLVFKFFSSLSSSKVMDSLMWKKRVPCNLRKNWLKFRSHATATTTLLVEYSNISERQAISFLVSF